MRYTHRIFRLGLTALLFQAAVASAAFSNATVPSAPTSQALAIEAPSQTPANAKDDLPAEMQGPPPAPASEGEKPGEKLLTYLEDLSNWYGTIQTLEVTANQPRTGLLKDSLRQNGLNAMQYGFDYAAAQATILDRLAPSPTAVEDVAAPVNATTNRAELNRAYKNINARVEALQQALVVTNEQLRRATSKNRVALTSRRDKLTDELALVQAQQDLLKTIVSLVKTTAADEKGGFAGQVANLRRTVPDLNPVPPASGAPAADKSSTTAADPSMVAAAAATGLPLPSSTEIAVVAAPAPTARERDGLFSIITDLMSQRRKREQVVNLLEQTKALRETTAELRLAVREELRNASKRGNEIAQSQTDDPTALEEQRKELKTLVTGFRRLAGVIVPLGQTDQRLEAAEHTLREWRDSFRSDTAKLARMLAVRLGVLFIGIAIPLVISEIVRRATNRYVADPRRQRQLRTIRRILVSLVLLFVILLNLVSELGSLATFIGFLTAGLAVALQNVLLSLVAHFFFFGRYGVRAGDRVSVNGITGDVLQVGMIRLYLAELERDAEGEFKPSGRMVAFPNSILFQPTAFFKQVKN